MLLRIRSFLFAFCPLTVLVLLTALAAVPAGAQTAPVLGTMPATEPANPPAMQSAAPSAGGESDPYTVSGVTVDISADNANVARDRAMAQAQAKAWTTLYQRLSPGGTVPKLSDTDLTRVVRGITVDDERITPTRYLASITVRFRPEEVRNHLAGTNTQYAEPPANAFVLLPVTMDGGRPILWEDHTPWRDAWEGRTASGLVPTQVPGGELGDIAAINAADAVAGDPAAIDRIARKYNAPGVIVVKTTLPPAGQVGPLTVDISRFDNGAQRRDQSVTVRPDPADRPDDLMRRAVIQTAAAIDDGYRKENAVAAGPEQTLDVEVPIASLAEWLGIKQRLTGISAISRAEMVAFSRSLVRLTLGFHGDASALSQQLATHDLGLAQSQVPGSGPRWELRLMPHSAAPTPVPAVGAGAPASLGPARP